MMQFALQKAQLYRTDPLLKQVWQPCSASHLLNQSRHNVLWLPKQTYALVKPPVWVIWTFILKQTNK